MIRQRFTTLLLAIFCFALVALAQTTPGPVATEPQPLSVSEVKFDPYLPGEKLKYVGKYKKLGFSFAIAEIDFQVGDSGTDGFYNVFTEGRSKGTLAKLFNFKFTMNIDSRIDGQKFQIEKTTKLDKQGERVRESEAEFDYQSRRVTFTETDPKDPTRAPRRVASKIGPDTQDMVSAVYRLRGLDLAVGKRFTFKVSDSGLVYDIPVVVAKREMIKSKLGKRWCFRIEPEVFGEGMFIEQKGDLVIWITDDVDRVPVLAEVETQWGDVKIKLREYSNLRSSVAAK